MMSPSQPYIILVNGDSAASDALSAAAPLAFAQWRMSLVNDLHEAAAHLPSEHEILVLLDPRPEDMALAQDIQEAGLPRWAVVVLSYGAGDANPIDYIPQPEWHPASLARILRQASRFHQLARLCARHEGDLHTIARRIRHDLNSPLNGILSMAELIHDITAKDHPEIEELMPSIFEAVDGMVALVDRVSMIAKASGTDKPREDVAMQDRLGLVLQKVEMQRLKRNGSIHVTTEMPVVHGVPEWLDIIWRTLLDNALKHGGEPPVIEVGAHEEADGWHFWVQDNGRKLSPEQRAGLFMPFHQLHTNNRAHGLGLSLVERLVALQGGASGCELNSTGTRFYFTLPKTFLS